jgi:hypothetical protein
MIHISSHSKYYIIWFLENSWLIFVQWYTYRHIQSITLFDSWKIVDSILHNIVTFKVFNLSQKLKAFFTCILLRNSPSHTARVNQHPCWYLHLFKWDFLVAISSPKKFRFELRDPDYSMHGIFVIFINNSGIFTIIPTWVFIHTQSSNIAGITTDFCHNWIVQWTCISFFSLAFTIPSFHLKSCSNSGTQCRKLNLQIRSISF